MGLMSFLGSLGRAAGLAGVATVAIAGCCPRPAACPPVVVAPPAGAAGPRAVDPAQLRGEGTTAVVVGAGPIDFELAGSPGFALRIEQAGEYQIDGLGTLDPVLRVLAGDEVVASDDNGGEGGNARLTLFLDQGEYRVQVQDGLGRPMLGQLEVRRLPDLEPSATLAPGQPVTVQVPAARTTRAATQALALAIAEPDLYQLDAVAASGGDAELAVLGRGIVLCQDSDSGEGTNARVECRLAPGEYQVRVWEYGRGAATIQVTVDRAAAIAARPLPPVPQAGTLSLGRPMVVSVPPATDPLSGTRGLAFTVTRAGLYQLDAAGPEGVDAELALVQDGHELQRDSDSGGGYDARLSRELAAGRYEVRVWEYGQAGGTIRVTATRQ